MLAQVDQSFDILLNQAKAGDADALGCLLESYRAYLRLIAGSLLRTASRASVDISDVVQETNLKACGNFPKFQGSDEPELVAWLRRILANLVFNLLKKQRHARANAQSHWRHYSNEPAWRPTWPWRPRGPLPAPRHRGGSRRS